MTRTVIARATPLAGQADALRRQIETLAHAVRAEPGNIRFEVYTEADGQTLQILESYRDDAAFDAHAKSAHTQRFNEALTDIVEGGASTVTELQAIVARPSAAPGIRAIDHVGVTVPNVDEATAFFESAFGAVTVYDVLPKDGEPMAGEGPEHELGLTSGTQIVHMRLMRIGNGPCVEMFQMADAESRQAPRLEDFGLTHFGLYVDDIEAAASRFEQAGGTLLSATHPLAGVEDGERNAGVYGRTPWGMLVEFITYPDGIEYAENQVITRWTPTPEGD
ncbi:antibiotic biosynthesis monooxygenase [Salinisphaera sp. Q1T1-3]|uniref:antibiotic biosynthesis monooxygenase n=1 Tax=Salinisphaera sp. Q1T1-3 TaxID=2321229 RepID=UPI001315017F|nr:antibiotic biosynthesis monooxygenase [Salinisphaera sp. Q1T1-3]